MSNTLLDLLLSDAIHSEDSAEIGFLLNLDRSRLPTMFRQAVAHGYYKTVKSLIKLVDINATPDSPEISLNISPSEIKDSFSLKALTIYYWLGCAPLMKAVVRGKHDIVELLLNNNADITLKDECGRTVFYYVINSDHRMRDLLRRYVTTDEIKNVFREFINNSELSEETRQFWKESPIYHYSA